MITKLVPKLGGWNKPMMSENSMTLGETRVLLQIVAKYCSQIDNILVAHLKYDVLIIGAESFLIWKYFQILYAENESWLLILKL